MTLGGLAAGRDKVVVWHGTHERIVGPWRTPLFCASLREEAADYGPNLWRLTLSVDRRDVGHFDAYDWSVLEADFRVLAEQDGLKAFHVTGYDDLDDKSDRAVESGEMWVIIDPSIIVKSKLVSAEEP